MACETNQALFETRDRSKFDNGSPSFEKPVQIGWFSLDIKRDFEISKKSLRYFVKPSNPEEVNFDLRKGYETMTKKGDGKEFNVLRWIMKNLDKFPMKENENATGEDEGATGRSRPMEGRGNAKTSFSHQHSDQTPNDRELSDVQRGLNVLKISKDGSKISVPLAMSTNGKPRTLNTDFVCRRGLLATIMCTPYEERRDWLIAIILHNGTYYLDDIWTEQKKEEEEKLKDDEMICWGWKFEQYLTAGSEDGVPNPDVPYNNCEAFYSVVRTQLNNHSLVFAGEVDALNIDKEKDSYYMEFKTTREFARQGHVNTFKRFKLRKWWAHSYIMGVREIVCGFRDDNGIVGRLEFYNTEELPNEAKISTRNGSYYNPWKPNVCFNFLDQFLTSIKSTIKTDDHKIVHVLKWTPGKPVQCSEPLRDSEHNFLPNWYTDCVK